MFQTDINIFLQSFASEPLTLIMKVISSIGYEEFFFIFLISIASGVNFRKGFLLMQLLMLTGLINQFLKDWFALPRPWFADSNLETFGKNVMTSFNSMGADKFWEVLPQNVVDKFRQLKPDSFGLPSGHTSTAIALWGSVAILFKQKWVRFICFVLIILIPLSRLYLARHFLADVLAGYLLGFLMLAVFYLVIFRKGKIEEFLGYSHIKMDFGLIQLVKSFYLFIFPIFAGIFTTLETKELAGFLMGLNVAYVLISFKKYPIDSGSIKQRSLRVLLTLLVFALAGFTIISLFDSILDDDLAIALFLRGFAIIFIGVSASSYLHKKFKLVSQ